MSRNPMLCLLTCVATLVMALNADVQGQSSTETAGEPLAETGQTLAAEVPEMLETPEVRDTQTRGSFVGTDTGDLPTFVGADQSGGATGGSQGRRTSSGSRRPTQPRQPSTRSTTQGVRSTLTLGFPYTPKVSPELGTNVRTCLGRIPDFGKNSSIRVSYKNKIVVLEGTVATKHDRMLALQMAALEPGVIRVDNRLKVVGKKATKPAVGY